MSADTIVLALLLGAALGYPVGVLVTLIFASRWLRWMERRDWARRR
jgi:hypothetical protein